MPLSWVDQLFRRLAQSGSRTTRSSPRSNKQRRDKTLRRVLQLESLEVRTVPSAVSTPMATPDILVYKHGKAKPDGGGNPGIGGYIPSQIAQAYGINQVSFNGVQGDGAGTTIAIVDAYSSPTIATDLQAFDKEFDLPAPPSFRVVNQTGGSTPPTADPGWAGEITLDVEWAHATAPDASILLVEANSASDSDLYTAVRYAEKQPGVVAVSMSFGNGEFPGETSYDTSTFSPTANPNLVFLASSGDTGAPVNYPSVSPNVLAVGGTNLTLTASNNYSHESGWGAPGDGSSSGGISKYETQPSYQKGVVTQSTTMRTTPDVSLVADPETGVDVYQTYGNPDAPSEPWEVVGGTSDASPQWAGLIAITDQGRALAGEKPLNNTILMPELYSLPTTSTGPAATADFHDILTGESLGTPNYSAQKGYDLVTGIGTPIVNNLIPVLVGGSSTSTAAGFSISAPTDVDLGLSFSITVTALNANGKKDTNYTGTINFSSSDPLADLPGSYTFTAADAGTQTFTVTLNTLGEQTITVTDSTTATSTGSTSTEVVPGYTFAVAGFPTSVTAGVPEVFTVTALAADGTPLGSGYSGTVNITSSINPSVIVATVNITNGFGVFAEMLETAGMQSLIATDTTNTDMTGSESGIVVTPAAATQLAFVQEPTNDNYGSTIAPAVVVAEEDPFGNIVTSDSSSQVTLALGSNPTGATLTGGGTETFTNGVATFSNLSVGTIGSNYTLIASSSDLGGTGFAAIGSSAFAVEYNPLLDNFNSGLGTYKVSGTAKHTATITAAAAHPGTGTVGFYDPGDQNWYYRTDAAGKISPGDTVTVWVEFPNAASGRAYFGFGSTSSGTVSVVLAPNTNQLLIQNNGNYNTYTTLASTSQGYSYNAWYELQVEWGASGSIIVNLLGSDGVTQINTVSDLTVKDTTAGDFSFRSTAPVNFDTVSVVRSVNESLLKPDFLTSAGSASAGVLAAGTRATTGSSTPNTFLEPVSSTPTVTTATTTAQPVVQTKSTISTSLLSTTKTTTEKTPEVTHGQISHPLVHEEPVAGDETLLLHDGIA